MLLGDREIFVHYGNGMGRSKLRIPAARLGTARNMNTVAKLAEIASKVTLAGCADRLSDRSAAVP
jgi:uncharacterized protein (DUF1697 family)